jgi:hypothetical protein
MQNALGIGEDVIVPEAEHAIAALLEPARARLTLIRMLSAIDLNDELRLGAKEIDDIRPNRVLATEAETFELLSPQTRPQPDLRIRRRQAQYARKRHGCA